MSADKPEAEKRQQRFRSQLDTLGFTAEELWRWLDPVGYKQEPSSIFEEIQEVLALRRSPSDLLLATVSRLIREQKRLERENEGLPWIKHGDDFVTVIKGVVVWVERDGFNGWRITPANDKRIRLNFSHSHPDLETQKRKAPMYVDLALADSVSANLW